MSRSLLKVFSSVGIGLALTGILFAQVSEKPPAAPSGKPSGAKFDSPAKAITSSDQAFKFRGLVLSETTPDKERPGYYERVLLPGPDEANLALGGAWEIPLDWAIELGKMSIEKRWSVIRRNLGLSLEAEDDFILWKEVIDALLDKIGQLSGREAHDYGLRVQFPGEADDAKAKVELSFNSARLKDENKDSFENELSQIIGGLWTGVEGFVKIVDDKAEKISPPSNSGGDGQGSQNAAASGGNRPVRPGSDDKQNPQTAAVKENAPPALKYLTSQELEAALSSIRIQLIDREGKEVKGVEAKLQGNYYRISSLPGDAAAEAKFGNDYWVRITYADSKRTKTEAPDKIVKEIYVPIRPGMRTRADVTLKWTQIFPPAGARADSIPAAPADVNTAYLNFLSTSPYLGALTQLLPANPGLHLGLLWTKGEGWNVFWSTRFRLLGDKKDRGPQFVDQGTLRLQWLTEANEPETAGKPSVHYVKMTWRGRADDDQLALKSRGTAKLLGFKRDIPGIGLGIVPSLKPSLFAIGLSLKPIKGCEVFIGKGIRQGYASMFVYGLTADIGDLLSFLGITGGSGGPGSGSSGPTGQSGPSGSAGQAGKGAATDKNPLPKKIE